MNDLKERYQNIAQQLQQAAERFQRPIPQLLAVSKKHPAEAIETLYQLGQTAFGESYAQEAIEKQQQLAHLPIEWHFIGPIQSNKTSEIANHFSWVHSIDRLKIARRLNDQRPDELEPLNICVQVNIDTEASKAGVAIADLVPLCEAIAALPKIRIRGLMCLPSRLGSESNEHDQRLPFATLAKLLEQLKQTDSLDAELRQQLDTLSMGMTNDYQAAIAEGATIVRIGTALFGARTA
ncbi:MAG: YggS family pyridoxal phosphate-dependent enzyme [Pseudomonadales bacterium]|nr:YggS family pyridoxal phosphate-dependent enzyme [Pseudomonadales bacterium]